MARIEPLIPIIFKWEGGWADDPDDKGGKTNMGVTLETWKRHGYDKNGDGKIDEEDLKLITREDVVEILRVYWNRWKADQIKNQSIANFLVDWVWNSGTWGIVIPQSVLRVPIDGKVGPITLAALHEWDQMELFYTLVRARANFIEEICEKEPSQMKFRNGWLNRINSFKFEKDDN